MTQQELDAVREELKNPQIQFNNCVNLGVDNDGATVYGVTFPPVFGGIVWVRTNVTSGVVTAKHSMLK